MKPGDIYLATVGIDEKRWARERAASIDILEWIPRIAEAGFDGIEIWEHHASRLDADAIEKARGIAGDANCPIAVFNNYVLTVPTDENAAHRRRINGLASSLGAGAHKFNITTAGKMAQRRDKEFTQTAEEARAERDAAVQFMRDWAGETDALFLCECHPGTIIEEPEPAAEVLSFLGTERFGAIVHSLTAGDDEFEKDLKLKRNLFRHAHVANLDKNRDRITGHVKRLKEEGLRLTWTIEFSSPVYDGADNETCFKAAVEDMKFLRGLLG